MTAPTLHDVGKRLADDDPPQWLVQALEWFARLIGQPKNDAEIETIKRLQPQHHAVANMETQMENLLDRREVCRFFGGNRPLAVTEPRVRTGSGSKGISEGWVSQRGNKVGNFKI
jgi:hypothetical protein